MDYNNGQKNENNKPNPQQPRKKHTSLLVGILIFAALIGLIIYFLVRNSNNSFAGSYGAGEFVHTQQADPANPDKEQTVYSGKIVELLMDDTPESQPTYGEVKQLTGALSTDKAYYYFNATVATKVTDSKGTTRYVDYKYEFQIDANTDYPYFIDFLSTQATQAQKVFVLTIPQTNNNSWISSLIFFVIIIALGWFLFRNLSKNMNSMMGGQGGIFSAGQSRAKKATSSKVKFTDVAGCDEVKQELVEIVDYFTNSKKYTALGAKLPKGVLLVGPPGTGKTLLAKAVAGEANVPFYSISGSDFVEMYVGVGASRVRDMFKTAKENSPCLIFIDEIDAVGRQRGAGLGGGNDEREQTLNQLLVEMDGFDENSGVIIMAATNRQDVLDPALLRPGRFDRVITVDYPDKEGREQILKVHSRDKKLAKDVDFDSIAKNTVGFAGADLANVMNEAAILAVRANRTVITNKDIDEAIDRRIAGPAKSNKHLAEKERWQVAYHESGHAIIGLKLEHSNKVQKITIVPRGRTGGHVLMTPENDRFLVTEKELLAEITGFLGGRSSEEVFIGDVSTGASNDFQQATNLARDMVTRYGMSKLGCVQYDQSEGNVFLGRDYGNVQRNYSDKVAMEIDAEVRRIIDECHAEAIRIITENREDVELLAKTVYEYETINASQIAYLLEHRHMPPVDEHLSSEKTKFDNYQPENKNNIELVKNNVMNKIYHDVDVSFANNPSSILLVASNKSAAPLTVEEMKTNAKNLGVKGKTAAIFLTLDEVYHLGMTIEELVSHLKSYSSLECYVIYGDETSVIALKNKFNKPKATSSSDTGSNSSNVTSNSAFYKENKPNLDDLGFVRNPKKEETTEETTESEEKSETETTSEVTEVKEVETPKAEDEELKPEDKTSENDENSSDK